jgi:hypothetical protein
MRIETVAPAVGIIAALAMSCEPVRSKNPLSDPSGAKVDPKLVGLWTARVDGKPMFLHVVPHPDGQMDLLLVGDSTHGAASLHYQGHLTEALGAKLLSLRGKTIPNPLEEKFELAPDWIFARYELRRDGSMALSWMDDEAPRKAIEAGVLSGRVAKGNPVRIEDESAKILAFIQAESASKPAAASKLWVAMATFRRVKTEPTPAIGK